MDNVAPEVIAARSWRKIVIQPRKAGGPGLRLQAKTSIRTCSYLINRGCPRSRGFRDLGGTRGGLGHPQKTRIRLAAQRISALGVRP